MKKADPTRPMIGGGVTRANTLPIHGDHYSTKPVDAELPIDPQALDFATVSLARFVP